MLPLHSESISQNQLQILTLLGGAEIGVLVGGSALAIQLGHRKSYDLDFVTHHFVKANADTIKDLLSSYQLKQQLLSDTQYTVFADQVKIILFQDTAPFLYPSVSFNSSKLAAYQDIFSTKLYILGRRATWRDYCDIAVCLDQHKTTLAQGISEAVKRYNVAERWILEPLTYFEDLEMSPIQWISNEYTEDEIKKILKNAAEEYIG